MPGFYLGTKSWGGSAIYQWAFIACQGPWDVFLPCVAHVQQGIKQLVCLLSVSIKIGKSQHLSECMVNKWDTVVLEINARY